MQWKAAALAATMAAGAMLSFGAPVSAAANLVAAPNSDLGRRPPETARLDWTFTPAAAGFDLFVAPGPGYGAFASPTSATSGADLFDGALSQALSVPPSRTPAFSFGLPAVWTMLIFGVALIGIAARHARTSGRQYDHHLSLYNHFTRND